MQQERRIDFPLHDVISGGLCWERLTEGRLNDPLALDGYGYKVYSQNDEDGILQEIFRRIPKRTIETNVCGALNILEAVHQCESGRICCPMIEKNV